jgi:hypothetical protein
MIPLIASLIFGALTFSDQDIDGIRIGPPNMLTGASTVNYRHADIDGDGLADLVLGSGILIQRAGRFPPEERIDLPPAAGEAALDLYEDRLYLRHTDHIVVWRREGGAWKRVYEQEIAWPESRTAWGYWPGASENRIRLERFLYDVHGDGYPDLVTVTPEGIHVFPGTESGWGAAVLLPLPPLLPVRVTDQQLWPPDARRITFPARRMSCRFYIHDGAIRLLQRDQGGAGAAQWQIRRWQLPESGAAGAVPAADSVTAPLFDWMEPCRLNEDDVQDFAGGNWQYSTASVMPVLLYESVVTLDGGTTLQRFRAPSFPHYRPQCMFIDFDGDGDHDLITESALLFEGGVRETVNRLLSADTLPHLLSVYVQAGGRFENTPRLRREIAFRLEKAPYRNGPVLERYRRGELLNITGDFNGDGYRDLVTRERIGRLSVYLAAGYGYPEEAAAELGIPGEARFRIADINADGRSDICIFTFSSDSEDEAAISRVWFAGESAP